MNFSQILALPVVLCFLSSAQQVTAQDGEIIPLWPDGAPGFEDRKNDAEVVEKGSVTNVHYPTLTAFRPPEDQGMGLATVFVPAGG